MNSIKIDFFLKAFEKAQIGKIAIHTPEGRLFSFKGGQMGPNCNFFIKDWSIIDILIKRGGIGLGEAYYKGLWEASDLADFLTYCSLNLDYLQMYAGGNFFNKIILHFYNKFIRLNTKYGSKKNILDHYDIGNDFYKLWLDPSMTYSSALRKNHFDSLEQAQGNKYQRIIDKLSLNGKNILEIGCGWGGFAEQALEAGAKVTGITLSDNQYHFSRQRLGDKADILIQDYRDIKNVYDDIISIEMFEAVGEKYWAIYFNKIKNALSKQGKALIQTITIADHFFERYRRSSDYIRHHIFPGGMLPSKKRFFDEVRDADLSVLSFFEFGLDYAWTLRQWRKNFFEIKDKLLAMNYTPAFIRAWDFYLSMCIAGFESGRTNVMQVEITH